jgi:transcriptional repressor NrdR
MRCPKCSHEEDKVLDSRSVRNGDATRRRRVCMRCGHRFTTYEEVLRPKLRIVKRDGRREDLDREKLISGMERACEKRPVSAAQIENIADAIIEDLEGEYDREAPGRVVGKKVMDHLERLDEVAYVRFASVYRRFKTVDQFLNQIEGMMHRGDLDSTKQ